MRKGGKKGLKSSNLFNGIVLRSYPNVKSEKKHEPGTIRSVGLYTNICSNWVDDSVLSNFGCGVGDNTKRVSTEFGENRVITTILVQDFGFGADLL